MAHNKKKLVLIVADGLGVGAMEDCAQVRPQSLGANSFAHAVFHQQVDLKNLGALGMNLFLGKDIIPTFFGKTYVGKCALKHSGADSYEGHNEILGNKPKTPVNMGMRAMSQVVKKALTDAGYCVDEMDGSALMVNGGAVVADNMETDRGQVINITGAFDLLSFETILNIGRIVRGIVKNNRVIAFGGVNVSRQDLLDAMIADGAYSGIDTPKLKVYNDAYKVCHMGYGVDPKRQCHTILEGVGIPVYLLGKMADVIDGEVTYRKSLVQTHEILEEIVDITKKDHGFICATLQQTDLFGHVGDVKSYINVLAKLDAFIPKLLEELNEGDMLMIGGDHGNDPTMDFSAHTREYTPFIAHIKGHTAPSITEVGVRKTLSDMGATVCQYFNVSAPEWGDSIDLT